LILASAGEIMKKVEYSTIINAINTKDYKFYSELSLDQKKQIGIYPFMQSVSAPGADQPVHIQVNYVLNINDYVNKHLWDIANKHTELAWLTMVTAVDYRKMFYPKLSKSSKKTKLENLIAEIYPMIKMSEVKMICKMMTRDQLSQLLDDLAYSKKEKNDFMKSVKFDT
jgi:hypothetical protein